MGINGPFTQGPHPGDSRRPKLGLGKPTPPSPCPGLGAEIGFLCWLRPVPLLSHCSGSWVLCISLSLCSLPTVLNISTSSPSPQPCLLELASWPPFVPAPESINSMQEVLPLCTSRTCQPELTLGPAPGQLSHQLPFPDSGGFHIHSRGVSSPQPSHTDLC